MKDRLPKFPGRIKLKPVAGQTDTYDMTRADDPDDTGTPFNARTMLQDSTGRFLRLPYANPLVDDAFRHMPDRIEPIGTVKTSPAFSLGKAWLPCDGSQVTFTEYPKLCQILRNTDGSVTWESKTIGTVPAFKSMSRATKFKGKWYIAGGARGVPKGSEREYYMLSIAKADSISGPYTVIYTETLFPEEGSETPASAGFEKVNIQLAASDERITAIIAQRRSRAVYGDSDDDVFFIATSLDAETWTAIKCKYPSAIPVGSAYAKPWESELDTDGTYWAFPLGRWVSYTTDPSSGIWQLSDTIHYSAGHPAKLCVISGVWFLTVDYGLFTASSPASGWSRKKDTISSYGYVTNVVFFSGQYWFFASVDENSSSRRRYLLHSTNLTDWMQDDVSDESVSRDYERSQLLATDKLLLLACSGQSSSPAEGVYATGDISLGWNAVALPAGAVAQSPSADGDVVIVSGESLIAYHDYSTETRLLPTISLSDDTTTFIKAKNELDVFETGG